MVVLESMSFVITPPMVSIPSVRGVYIQEDDVAHATFFVQDGTLDRCTYGYHLIGIYTLGWLFAEVVLNQCLHGRYTA